jgi:hypothetical protein
VQPIVFRASCSDFCEQDARNTLGFAIDSEYAEFYESTEIVKYLREHGAKRKSELGKQ